MQGNHPNQHTCPKITPFTFEVSICDINTDAGEDLLHQLSKTAKDRVIFCPCDVTDYPQFEGSGFLFAVFHLT